MVDIQTDYLGMVLKNPIIVGSSGLTDSVEKVKDLEEHGAGAVVLKSLFEEEIIHEMEEKMQKMTGRPVIYPETFDYMEEDDLEEDSVRTYIRLIKECKEAVSIPVIASINCISSQKWTYFAQEIERAGADALELNLFILPTNLNDESDYHERIYFDVIKKVDRQVAIPIVLKIGYFHSNLGNFIKRLSETAISGLVMFNSFYKPDFDIDTFSIKSAPALTSPHELYTTLRWIAIISERIECHIAGSAGVHNEEDLVKLILAGANAVQIVSSVYINGPEIIKTFTNKLQEWMEKHEFSSISEFRSKMCLSNSYESAAFHRVQYMKYIRNFDPKSLTEY